MALHHLPELSLARLAGSPSDRAAFLDELRTAAHDFGFFYLSDHGVPTHLIEQVLSLSRRFFRLPEADKQAIGMIHSPQFRGYNRAGLEHTRGKPDWREQLDIGPEAPGQPIDRSAPPWTRLIGPNQWPAGLPQLKPVLLTYLELVTTLGVRLTEALAEALGQDRRVFAPIYTPAPNQLLKIIRYPGRAQGSDRQGVGPHKDSGFLTVLLQDTVSGLQVEGAGGWIDAPPVPGTFIINIGELLEMASSGYLRANVHRVVSPLQGIERLSVAFFLGARLDADVPVLSLPASLAAETRGITRDPLNPLFREVARNYLKSRLRSHPDVALRFHADLIEPAESPADKTAAGAY